MRASRAPRERSSDVPGMPSTTSDTVRTTVDAFIEAAEEARRRLIRAEGRDVSWREVIRRAGYEHRRAFVAYHLNPKAEWPRGHNVPPEIVHALAGVLPVSEEELARAARVAAGYNVVEETTQIDADTVASVVLRFYGSEDVTDEERAEATRRLLTIIADEMGRGRS